MLVRRRRGRTGARSTTPVALVLGEVDQFTASRGFALLSRGEVAEGRCREAKPWSGLGHGDRAEDRPVEGLTGGEPGTEQGPDGVDRLADGPGQAAAGRRRAGQWT